MNTNSVIRLSRMRGLSIFNTNVRMLFLEYLIDPNCRPELWIKDCGLTDEGKTQFMTLCEWHGDVWKKKNP
jgi:hypothetical protein